MAEAQSNPSLHIGQLYHTKRWAKGKRIDAGVSGIVELLHTGHVIKSAWPEDEECREDMAQEARAYERLSHHFGKHKRFVRFVAYDVTDFAITMEYMVNGNLRDYLKVHNDSITRQQRCQWICALAEGMEMLHSVSIIHCDFSPRNMFLDDALELKVADFGGVSIDRSRSSAGGSARFYPPRVLSRDTIEIDDDLFALGSSIFEVITGQPPYMDLDTEQIRDLYRLQQFPDLTGIQMNDIIRDCWLLRAQSAQHVHQRVLHFITNYDNLLISGSSPVTRIQAML